MAAPSLKNRLFDKRMRPASGSRRLNSAPNDRGAAFFSVGERLVSFLHSTRDESAAIKKNLLRLDRH